MSLDVIVRDSLDVEWCSSIVWLTRKCAIPSQSKVVGVKYKEVNGDRAKALELAIKRYIGTV